ncbi:MAG: hypothetical protein ABIP90_02330 [Vicinamibacterales bacterium]
MPVSRRGSPLKFNVRSLHKLLGLVLLLPMAGWAMTGFVFFVKPGYGGAYESLMVKTYPMQAGLPISAASGWLEYRGFRTVLGDHLLVRTTTGWRHLNPGTLQPAAAPSDVDLRRLVTDAFTANPQRYGNITRVDNGVISTDTGVEVTLDWTRVSLQQHGRDTARIDQLYRVHYLQWTGVTNIDRGLGFTGLALMLALTALGVRLAFGRT